MIDAFDIRDEISPEIFNQAVKLWHETGLYRAHRGDSFAVLERTIASGGRFFTLWDGAILVGTAWLMCDGRRLHLHYMAIHPDYQGLKCAHILMKRVMEYAREIRLGVKLEVHVRNTAARSLYERYGFEYLDDYIVMLIRNI
jgi:ribosomal protein S18 acetylase RimI-like enzyme